MATAGWNGTEEEKEEEEEEEEVKGTEKDVKRRKKAGLT